MAKVKEGYEKIFGELMDTLEYIRKEKEETARKVEDALIEFEQKTGMFIDHIEIARTAPQGGRTNIAMVKIIADVTE